MANSMDSDNLKKMFIGGLSPETTNESLTAFYSQWGEVADAIVMRDSATKRSRGFGFITYKQAYSVDECMKARPHVIDGKQIDPKRATPKEDANNPVARKQVKKIFVGGIKDVTENSDLMGYFSQFGPVTHAEIVVDKSTGRKRGFAFVTYDDSDSVDKCVLIGSHTLNGNPCEVKKAVERGMMQEMGPGAAAGMAGPGRGGPRGGGPPRGAPRGGYAPYGGGPPCGYASYGAGRGGSEYGSGGYGPPPPGPSGYGPPGGGYGSGGYGPPGGSSWNYGGYGDPYASGTEFGTGYGTSNGGGAMKSGGYASRAAGPYSAGGSYGAPGGAGGGYAGYNSYGGGPGYAAAGGGGYGGYGQS